MGVCVCVCVCVCVRVRVRVRVCVCVLVGGWVGGGGRAAAQGSVLTVQATGSALHASSKLALHSCMHKTFC